MILFFLMAYADEPIIVYKKETTIDFEGLEVEGQVKKPPGILSMERTKAKFNPLVQLKESFGPEIEESILQID